MLTGCGDDDTTQAALAVISSVSVDSAGAQGNGSSGGPALSNDGRYVAFSSGATNLVTGDTNGFIDVFVHDLQTGATTRVSVDSSGAEGNGDSFGFSISNYGRYVAFQSEATNLVAGDTNGVVDVFVHDTQTGATTRVSVDSSGAEGNGFSGVPSISGDGRYVAFQSDATNLQAFLPPGIRYVFVHDMQTGATTRVVDSVDVEANGSSSSPALSNDGRYVAFSSRATNLVAGDTNGFSDVFVHDLQTGTTTRVSVDSAGAEGDGGGRPSISGDGRYVAFESFATNFVAGDTNGFSDVFVHDLQTGATTRVSVDSAGAQGNGDSFGSSISNDGRYVAFGSEATNLVEGDTNGAVDVFVHDLQTGATTRISVDSSGAEGNDLSLGSSISGDGRYVAFSSRATNLVPGDTNGFSDVFRAPNQYMQGSALELVH